jgi:superfamily II DNA or RNA helicase
MDAFYAHFDEIHHCSKSMFQREVNLLIEHELIVLETTRSEQKRHALTPTLTPRALQLLAKAQSTLPPKCPA